MSQLIFLGKSINSKLDSDIFFDAKIRCSRCYFMISNFNKTVKYYSSASLDIEKNQKISF